MSHLLLHADGTHGSTDFPDSSGQGHIVTAMGSAIVSTVQKKFGTASANLPGSSYLSVADSDDFDPGAGDFTFDWWEYRLEYAAHSYVFVRRLYTGGVLPAYLLGGDVSGYLMVYMTNSGSSWDIASGRSLGVAIYNEWVHRAVTREGNTFRTFANGIQQDTWSNSYALYNDSAPMLIGNHYGYYFKGYLDELHIVKGTALYTENFTPPTEPYGEAPEFLLTGLVRAHMPGVSRFPNPDEFI